MLTDFNFLNPFPKNIASVTTDKMDHYSIPNVSMI